MMGFLKRSKGGTGLIGRPNTAPPREQREIAFIGHMDYNSALLFIMRSLFFSCEKVLLTEKVVLSWQVRWSSASGDVPG